MLGEQQAPIGVAPAQGPAPGAPQQQQQGGGGDQLAQLLEGVAMGIAKLKELAADPSVPPEFKAQIGQVLGGGQEPPMQQESPQAGPNGQPVL